MKKKVFFLLLIVFISSTPISSYGSVLEAFKLAKLANISCIHYHVKGICVKWHHGHPKIGIKIEMWKPVLLVETVKRPFHSSLPLVDLFASIIPVKIASSGSITSTGSRNLQFNEVHIMSFPFSFFLSIVGNIVPMWCGGLEAPFPTLYYLSEIDALNWRQTADMFTTQRFESSFAQNFRLCDLMNLSHTANSGLDDISSVTHNISKLRIPSLHLGNMCVGDWGVLYPRVGWNSNQSETVGSAMDVFRGVSWDSVGNRQPRIAFLPIPFTPSTDDELQEALPHKSGCFKIGENPARWDHGLLSANGKYLWIYWKHFECCKF